jgi:WD40 repeat protein
LTTSRQAVTLQVARRSFHGSPATGNGKSMAESSDQYPAENLDATGEFFSVGGPLHAVRAGYVRRPADEQLYRTLFSGHYAHVIAPDRTGKSSLIASTSARLQNNGVKVAIIDLEQIAERDGGADAGRWYYSIVYRLLRQLRLKVDLLAWWQDKAILSFRQRLVEFFIEIILPNIDEPVVVFVDQIQCTADLPFAEHLLASIRAAHNARSTEPEFSRLSFALIGECDPSTLVSDVELSPFVVSREIMLGDFTRSDLDIFVTELNLSGENAIRALDRIFDWTSGHPYLTQKLCRAITREKVRGNIEEQVDRIAVQQLAGRAALHSEPHMSHLHRLITAAGKLRDGMLNTYGKLRKGIAVPYDAESKAHSRLLASGLVVRDSNDLLIVKNRLYRSVFTTRWANENLPLHWRGPAIAAGLFLLFATIPFLYTQVLPRPYANLMFNPSVTLEQVAAAHRSLQSFPGHGEDADRLYRTVLTDRAALATELGTITQIESYARLLDPSGATADSLLALFWDRQVKNALRDERRDDALIASLESLVETTPWRRRRAATLIGDDYPQLVGTIPGQRVQRMAFDPADVSMHFVEGANVETWNLAENALQEQSTWVVSALDVTPLVRRVVVDREGVVTRIGLSINVSHARLSDLLVKLIAPSGRSVDLQFRQASSSSIESIRIDRTELDSLKGELLAGTWSLSTRDEAIGIDGHLVGWDLSLNSQVLVESFDRGLDIPDPFEKAPDSLWLSPSGKYAIARSSQSDGVRLWDLSTAQAVRTIAVPASDTVIGISPELGYVVTAGGDAVNVWRTSDGRRQASMPVGIASQQIRLSEDRQHLLVQSRGESNTIFELWSLDSMKSVARLAVAGTPALVTIDASGSHLAVADYDRSVRVWDFRGSTLLAQFNLVSQPSRILLSPDGRRLGAVHGDRGVSLWHADVPDAPLLQERQTAQWQIAFSGTGQSFVAGSPRYGFQVYRSYDGRVTGPLLGSGMADNATTTVSFSNDERFIVTASPATSSRAWRAPRPAQLRASADSAEVESAHRLWREAGNSVSAISPGGDQLAIGDSDGHVHIVAVDAAENAIADANDEVSYLGHAAPVTAIAFSRDGSLVASAAGNGSIRLWDSGTGSPKPFTVHAPIEASDQMQFSPDNLRLAVNGGRRVWVVSTATGNILSEIELGETHASMAFANDEQLYLGGESGTLRLLAPDRSGSWNLRNVWTGTSGLRRLAVSPTLAKLVLVNASNEVRSLDLRNGRVSELTLTMPDVVSDILFNIGETRVLLRTPRWIHRAALSGAGLVWMDAIRAPKAMPGSKMILDPNRAMRNTAQAAPTSEVRDNDKVLILTREAGFAEMAELQFDYSDGPSLIGKREELLDEWRSKLAVEPQTAPMPLVAVDTP